MRFGAILSLLFGLALTACVSAGNQAHESAEANQAAKEFKADSTRVTIYIYSGLSKDVFFDRDQRTPSNFFINEKLIGGLNKGEFFVVKLPPGKYTFEWCERLDSAKHSAPLELTASAGEIVYLRSILDKGAAPLLGVLFGAVGGAVGSTMHQSYIERVPDGRDDLKDRILVKADDL